MVQLCEVYDKESNEWFEEQIKQPQRPVNCWSDSCCAPFNTDWGECDGFDDSSQPHSATPLQLLAVPSIREACWVVGHSEEGKQASFSVTSLRSVRCSALLLICAGGL